MGNAPSEANMGAQLRCTKCYKVLPACYSFSDYYTSTVNEQTVYVFNNGAYYRPVGHHNAYICGTCFHSDYGELLQRREQQRQMEEKRKREAEERKRQEELNQRLEKSHQQAQNQFEKQLNSEISEEHECKRQVLISHLDEFEANFESDSDSDKLLEILSAKYNISIPNLRLNQLTADELGKILSALDELLFDEWISTLPSLSTLQHTQVFITELCALSLDTSEGLTLQITSNRVQSLVESISQSTCNVSESFLLTQALYHNLMYFFSYHDSCDNDAVLIAERWAEDDLSAENLFVIEFLSNLTSSLQNANGKSSGFCLKLLLFTLTHLNEKESHVELTEILLSLVQTNQWKPIEAVTLLNVLLEQYAEDTVIIEVLILVHVYNVSPTWTDDSGHSLIQALEISGSERFQQDFQNTLRNQEESRVDHVLTELKTSQNLDDSVIEKIKTITINVLLHSLNAPKLDSFELENLNAEDIQSSLSQLCKAVSYAKGWWPTAQQMVRWCLLVLTENIRVLELIGINEDPCVIAMFAATQVHKGNKLDIVLDSEVHSHKQIEEWSSFYKHLGISVNTNAQRNYTILRDIYKSDIVYGIMDDFVSDYFQLGLEVMKTGEPHLCRRFLITEESIRASHNLKLPKLKENDALSFAADILQNLLGNFNNEDVELRHGFIKALFQVLNNHLNKDADPHCKLISFSQKLSGKQISKNEVYILSFLENFLQLVTEETETKKNTSSPTTKWCLEALFDCASQFQSSEKQIGNLLQMASNLGGQQPVETLNLLLTLANHHYDEDCISMKKILHLMETYQVSTDWRDGCDQSLLEVLQSLESGNLMEYLEEKFRKEEEKSIDILFDELSKMEHTDEETLKKSQCIVNYVTNLIISGDIRNHTDTQKARSLSHSTDTKDLQEILAVLCNAVYLQKFEEKYWPRATQMISWCLLALSDTGKLLEMGTGEGKSCVIAMFAAFRALRGEKVDVVSSSSVLCQRDAEEWTNFYSYFNIKVDTNTNKTKDKDRKQCYQKDVVYGTIEAFAADHLRQIFEMKDVRPHRGFQCIIIDEVDSLLLDQGVQLTYLSSTMASMQHLNVILSMIWGRVSQYGFLSTGHKTFVQGPPALFFKAIFNSIDAEGTEIEDPIDILTIAEELDTVPKGFTEDLFNNEKDQDQDFISKKLKNISQTAVVDFFKEMEQYVPYCFTLYTLDDNGLLVLEKPTMYSNQDIPELTFLILEEGLCCSLYDSEEILIQPIAQLISGKIQYTPDENSSKDKVSIPGFLRDLIEKKVSLWVQNAFLALRLNQGREYVVEDNSVFPVDFRSTGIVEVNKKWGDGLQQFVEMKHRIKLSTISTVTNYVSNLSFFEKYHEKIYGTTGTLGSETDMKFLQKLYPTISACKTPSFNRKKLFEVKGTLKISDKEWKAEIKCVIMDQISPNSYRDGRAALVICETINKAQEIFEALKGIIPGEIILYCRSDNHSLSKIDKELHPGDVIVATNLAGRGTDIKVSKEVNNNGGLFVILSFLSENTRVELQAFGRTARKGKPGSAQIILATDHLQDSFKTVLSLKDAKETRDRLAVEKVDGMMNDIKEMKLREDLFSEYCETLQNIYNNQNEDEKKAVVAVMNEFWGIWLQTKSEDIDQLKTEEVQKSLKDDLSKAKSQSQSKTSPCCCIYHYIKFGDMELKNEKWAVSFKLFEKAMEQDPSWAAIAFYNHAYLTINQKRGDYLTIARKDLCEAQRSLQYFSEECVICMQLVKMSSADSTLNSNSTSLEKQIGAKYSMISYFDENISKAIKMVDELKGKGASAEVRELSLDSLAQKADEDLKAEMNGLCSQGLKFLFSVEEEPKSPWGALWLCLLGLAQIVVGGVLIYFGFPQIGIGFITEGISDIVSCIKSIVKGEFSWKDWAIDKAISVVLSLLGCGLEKLVATHVTPRISTPGTIELFGKGPNKLKPQPKFLSRQTKEGYSVVAKTNLKNAVQKAAKKMEEEFISHGLGKEEEETLKEIINSIRNDIKMGIADDVKSKMDKEPLNTLVDLIILSHLEDKQQLHDLLHNRTANILDIFKELGNTALQPFFKDLTWQNKLNSTISAVIDKVKSDVGGKLGILTTIQTLHMGPLAADAISTVETLSSNFFSKLNTELDKFIKENNLSGIIKQNDLSSAESEMLKAFKRDLADTMSGLLPNAFVEVFHQKFSGHLISFAQNKVNGIITNCMKTGFKSQSTVEKLRAGQTIAHTTVDPNSNKARETGKHSLSHAQKIRESMVAGDILDMRILSEAFGIKVAILTEDCHGKLIKMQELNPGSKPASKTVTLIYRPRSTQHPSGYDVLIDNQIVSVDTEGKNCMFHALAKGMQPKASEKEIAKEASRLRSEEANILQKYAGQWELFVKRKYWLEEITGGDWYTDGAERQEKKKRRNKMRETKNVLKEHVEQVKQLRKEAKNKHDEMTTS